MEWLGVMMAGEEKEVDEEAGRTVVEKPAGREAARMVTAAIAVMG